MKLRMQNEMLKIEIDKQNIMGGNGGGCDREQTINSTKMYS